MSGLSLDEAAPELNRLLHRDGSHITQDWLNRRDNMVQSLLNHNSFYRARVGNFSGGWSQLPIMQKSDYQGDLKTLISSQYRSEDLYISSTSGSSGHPFHFAKTKRSHALTWAITRYLYAQHGVEPEDMQARFYGIPKEPLDYYKEKLKDFFLNRRRFPVFDLSDEALAKFVQRFEAKAFHYLYGYANSLLLFAEYLERNKIVLKTCCPALKCCITTSEMCSPEDRALMSRAFGVKVINEYGSSETGIMAFENPEGEWVLNTLNQYFEVVDDKGTILPEGEEGNLLVTDLYNDAFPFVRYAIGDRASIRSEITDGRRKYILNSLSGRINDTILLPSGKKAAGLTFYYVSRGILNSSGVIREFIIRQKAIDLFLFEVVSNTPLTAAQIADINEKLITYLEPGVRLEIKQVSEIDRPANGKRKHFISEINR